MTFLLYSVLDWGLMRMSQRDFSADWLNTVAHDLKTPINSVRGCILLVQQLGPLTEKQQQFTQKALNGLQRMEHLVSRLLDISWVDADAELDLTEIPLQAVVDEAIEPLREIAEQRDITIGVEFDPRIRSVVADARRVGQVIDNLVSNAIKYNRDGGKVFVKVAYEPDAVHIQVQDTGIGISDSDQVRVFERFFRAREGVALRIEGSGLGLAITKAIVQKHGGRIWFQSKQGEGASFFFTLPLHPDRGDGSDSSDESSQDLGEGNDGRLARRTSLASEERDVVNDNMQEKRHQEFNDSSSDEK